MTIYLPIIGYAPAEGSGVKASTPEGQKNVDNLADVSAAMSWIERQSSELIGNCGAEYQQLTSPFYYFDGSRIAFDSDIVFRSTLESILTTFRGKRVCLLVPSRKLFFDNFESEVIRILWDRKEHGLRGQVLSVKCDDYPLGSYVGIPKNGIFDYLCENALRTNIYMTNWVNGQRANQRAV